MNEMKPLFSGLLLTFIFLINEIETSGKKPRKIKTNIATASRTNDKKPRRDDNEYILNCVTPARQKKNPSRWDGFKFGKDYDKFGTKAHEIFEDHYLLRGVPNTPRVTLDLFNERHDKDGRYHLPEEQFGTREDRFDKARGTISEPWVQEHHQKMYQEHQAFQDQYSGYASGSGYNHLYTVPPMSPSENLYAQLDVQPPKHLDFEESFLQNNPSATAMIDNYNIHLRNKYGGYSKGSSSG